MAPMTSFPDKIQNMISELNLSDGDASLEILAGVVCNPPESFSVEFFSGRKTVITVVSSESADLPSLLDDLDDGQPISIDFEWKPDRDGHVHAISTFQFATSKKILVILNDSGDTGAPAVKDFLLSHKCFGKGMTCDNFKLQKMFGVVFYFEDIEISKLVPHELPLSFNLLVEQLIGSPAASFKNKHVSCSDWSSRPLTLQQILYASFDVYAMRICYQEIQTRFNDFEFTVTPPTARLYRSKKTTAPAAKKVPPISAKKALRARPYDDTRFLTKDQFYMFVKSRDEETEFIPRPEYTTRWSLYHRFLATNRACDDGRCLDCGLKFASQEELAMHLWSQHVDDLPRLFFCRQTDAFVRQMLGQVVIARNAIVHTEAGVSCGKCGAKVLGFRGLYTHCRIQHLEMSEIPSSFDIKKLLFEILCGVHEVDPVTSEKEVGKCRLCDVEFADNDAIIEHCWFEHAHHILEMWMSRPICYPEIVYTKCFDLGVYAMKTMAGLTSIDGSYACAFCQTGSDDPGELFVHMLHKHAAFFAVPATDISDYPLRVSHLPDMLQDVVRRANSADIQTILIENGIFDSTLQQCCECNVEFANMDELWEHIVGHHLVIGFHPA